MVISYTTATSVPAATGQPQAGDIILASLWPSALVLVVLIISIATVTVKRAAIASAEVVKTKAIDASLKDAAVGESAPKKT